MDSGGSKIGQNETQGAEYCKYCDKYTVVRKNEYLLCDNCKTVYFEGLYGNDPKKIYSIIQNYIDKIQSAILEKEDKFQDIEQKYVSDQKLSMDETETRDLLLKFQDLRCALSNIIKNQISLDDEESRKLLYDLLEISVDLEKLVYE